MSINLKVPELQELKPRITVIGVGGAGGNAVNNMIASGLNGVDFVVANTDAQALTMSGADTRIQMGVRTTEGLGAGSKPEIGRDAAEEAEEEIRSHLSGAHMVFVAAGMGGGTGTGAAPIVAKVAQEEGVLTVGVVTKPFHFEGKRRMKVAEEGLEKLRENVDTLIVIPNQNLFRIANERTTFAEAFKLADRVLHAGIACITDLIIKDGLINLDFADVRAVMNGMGTAVMGTGQSASEHRAIEAAEEALANPLLDDVSLRGARGLLISITGGDDLTLYEVDEAATRIREEVDPDANIILGAAFDNNLNGHIRVSIVASGVTDEPAKKEAPRELPLQNSLQHKLGAAQLEAEAEPEPAELHQEPEAEKATPTPEKTAPPHAASVPRQSPPPQAAERSATPPQTGKVRIEKRPPQLVLSPDAERAEPLAKPPEAEAKPAHSQQAFVPSRPVNAPKRPPRMPEVEEFSPHAQQAIQGGDASTASHGIREQKKRLGFFERLANATRQKMPGDSRNIAQSPTPSSTKAPTSAPNVSQAPSSSNTAVNNLNAAQRSPQGGISVKATKPTDSAAASSEIEEGIDIPPFLRRGSS